jgi:nucleoside-diphosphate kinase
LSRTLLIVKPDATDRNLIGHIINRIERASFKIVEMKMVRLTEAQAREFYAVHEGKPFLDSLVAFMTSGPVVPMVLEKVNAVEDTRTLIGATNPANAACGTIRNEIALNIEKNSTHASDSDENAAIEIAFFFGEEAAKG